MPSRHNKPRKLRRAKEAVRRVKAAATRRKKKAKRMAKLEAQEK